MNKVTSKTRSHETRIEIGASVEDVWKALVEAEEIVRWFAPEAKVEPGVDGTYWISWGEGMGGGSRIAVWEPGKRLRLDHRPEAGAETPSALAEPIVQEFYLETDGERTFLRLVQSGVPTDAAWDDFYEDTRRGWKLYFAGLRHYLERHFGRPRMNVMFMHPVKDSLENAWKKLTGPEGLAASGNLEGLEPGERRSLETAFGQSLEIEVLFHEPPFTLTVNLDNLSDSLLCLDFERMGGKTFLYANLSTFRIPESAVGQLREDWGHWLERLFPVPAEAEA